MLRGVSHALSVILVLSSGVADFFLFGLISNSIQSIINLFV